MTIYSWDRSAQFQWNYRIVLVLIPYLYACLSSIVAVDITGR